MQTSQRAHRWRVTQGRERIERAAVVIKHNLLRRHSAGIDAQLPFLLFSQRWQRSVLLIAASAVF
jgi:hypothetical protein